MWINNIIDHIKLPFRKEKELFSSLYEILGFYPHHIEYYRQALMHKSIGKRTDKGKPLNNERLEFLGDAILDAIDVFAQYAIFPEPHTRIVASIQIDGAYKGLEGITVDIAVVGIAASC